MVRPRISPWLPVGLCLLWRILPRGMFLPLLLALAVHELGHILWVYLCGGRITAMALGLRGAVLETSALSYGQEVLCALGGPVAGLLLLLFRRVCPGLAFWGLVQSLYNLLPVYPLDGGRALNAGLSLLLSPQKAQWWTVAVSCMGVAVFGVWSWGILAELGAGLAALFPAAMLLGQTLPEFLSKQHLTVAKKAAGRYNKG